MAHMLDGPVPDGARSVSWPWYHHVLTNELTVDARTLFEQYARILPKDVENHIYRIVSPKPSGSGEALADVPSLKERQSLGDLPMAMYWGILVSQLRPGQAPALPQFGPPTVKNRRFTA